MRLTLIAATLLTLASAASGGSNRWTSSGPGTGIVSRIEVDSSNSSIVYARTAGGIFRSDDAGDSWAAVTAAVRPDRIGSFLLAADSTLYISAGDTVFASTDRGARWSLRGTIANANILTLAYNGASGSLYAGTDTGIEISTDGGQTWATAKTPPPPGRIVSMVVTSNAVYAVSLIPQIDGPTSTIVDFRSTDDGRTWLGMQGPGIMALFGYEESPSVYTYTRATVLTSNDLGASWKQSPIPSALAIDTLSVSSAGLYAATDAGVFVYNSATSSWSAVGKPLVVEELAPAASVPPRVYAVSSGRIVTLDDQNQWVRSSKGLPGANALDVAMPVNDPSVRYATTDDGLFRSDDSGFTWRPLTRPNLQIPSHISLSPGSDDTALVWGSSSVARTSDGGATWKTINTTLATQLAIAQSRGQTVYAALADGMAKSMDGGDTWAPTATIPLDGYDYGYYGYGIFTATSIAVDPKNESNAFVAKGAGLYSTMDGGGSWTLISAEPNLRALQMDPGDSASLYGGGNRGGVMRSTDRGATWRSAGLIDKYTASLAIAGARLYAGTDDGHIYFTEDGGASWTGMDSLSSSVSSIAVDASGTSLAVAAADGVWQYDIAGDDTRPSHLPEDALRLPHALAALLGAPSSNGGVVIPVIGTVAGAGGMTFTTEVTLVNNGSSTQQVLVVWLPESGGTAQAFAVDVPAGSITIWNAGDRFAVTGIGSLAVFGIDSDGNVDTNASVDAAARIWAHPVDGRAPVGQSIPAARPALFSRHRTSRASGLTQDAQVRTNVGIVNLSSTARDFVVTIQSTDPGNGSRGETTIHVEPFAIVQTPLIGDYGSLSLEVNADAATEWLFYGSSVNQASGEAHTSVGMPVDQ